MAGLIHLPLSPFMTAPSTSFCCPIGRTKSPTKPRTMRDQLSKHELISWLLSTRGLNLAHGHKALFGVPVHRFVTLLKSSSTTVMTSFQRSVLSRAADIRGSCRRARLPGTEAAATIRKSLSVGLAKTELFTTRPFSIKHVWGNRSHGLSIDQPCKYQRTLKFGSPKCARQRKRRIRLVGGLVAGATSERI